MEKIINNGALTDMLQLDFKDGFSIFVSLPGNIASAEHRDDVVVRWIDENFNNVKRITFDVPRTPEDDNFGAIITPCTNDDTYEIFFPNTEPIYGEMEDEDVDKLDAWLDVFTNNIDYWENYTQEG
jgi:hypothetical protein